MSSNRILIIEHERDAGIGLLGERLHRANIKVDTVGPERNLPLPETLAGYDGVIVLGGTPGPTDDDVASWMPQVRALTKQALDQDIPMLGVCLGAQILAIVAGGEVSNAEHPEVGVSGFQLNENAATDPLLRGLQRNQRAMQWHFLEVTKLPPGTELLASSPHCKHEAFRIGEHAWGFQFHLEATAQTAHDWSRNVDNVVSQGLIPEEVIATMESEEASLHEVWAEVADRWLNHVAATSPPRSPSTL